MAYYSGGTGAHNSQRRFNYQPNLDPNLLATVRDEMLRKEEQQKQQQQRMETEKKLFTYYLTHLQAMVRDLPRSYKQKFTYDVLSSIATSFLDGTVFEIVKGLEDIQQLSERNFLNKRMKLVNTHKAQRMKLSKEHEEKVHQCRHRAHHLPIVEAENAKEKEDLEKRLEQEMTQVDQKLVLELDQLVFDQQATLQRAGIPLFFVTNNPDDTRLQMYILEFIQRLAPSPGGSS